MIKEAKKIIDGILRTLYPLQDMKYAVELPPPAFDADVSTNVAILLAGKLKKSPADIANEIIPLLNREKNLLGAEFRSGFINIKFSDSFIAESLAQAIKSGCMGKSETYKNKKILVEFVSANPTGPLHIGHGRGAVYGDSLSRIFEYLGATVEREYYINNVGNQMDVLAESVRSRIMGFPLPENGYKGKYIEDIADEIKKLPDTMTQDMIKDFTIKKILGWIDRDLKTLNICFDSWFEESSLYKKKNVDAVIDLLVKKGYAYESDGAIWFRSTAFSDDKDRVIKRADGRHTYLASDIAYHHDKYKRGYDLLINIWGADHHGYVERMKGSVSAAGNDPEKLKIILYQLVNIIKGDKKISMSTRSGEFITLREVIEEVGADAVRFFMLVRSAESHFDFDMDLAKKQAPENPVYYVQYAHARICSIFGEASSKGIKDLPAGVASGLLTTKEERKLIKDVMFFGDLVESAARDTAPHYITKYLMDISADFHSYYNKHRVLTDSDDLSVARLQLCGSVVNAIKSGLFLLGISAPERM
ncbi:MAG: Arginine--tRNA ligase [Elusimicrobia bacterium ADurb.Bin231]|nr:MAG: Arginine--tRNA ligase [Elusimicrobia bacterium ADurb.Bin231]